MEGDEQQVNSAAGVRYITEDLIRKVAKQENLDIVTNLTLVWRKEGDKKIKYIENLTRLKRLQVLNLSNNVIARIEKLEMLSRLRELNLSYNCISKIENLESLTCLQVLNLTSNQIEHIPAWLGKKLHALRTVLLARNAIQSVNNLNRLRPLRDLSQLTIAENPVSQLPHCRPYCVFLLRTLDTLDGQKVTAQERENADSRFEQEAVELLEKQLQEESVEKSQLEEERNKSLQDLETSKQKQRDLADKLKAQQQKVKELEKELESKNNLLKSKTTELKRACDKHYELEQELTFYKLDHKFESLTRPTPPTPDMFSQSMEDVTSDESPYIGKGRYQRLQFPHDQRPADSSQASGGGRGSAQRPDGGQGQRKPDGGDSSMSIAVLEQQLADKDRALKDAEKKLEHLQAVTKEMSDKLSNGMHSSPWQQLTEDDKQHLYSHLKDKLNTVERLQGEASDLQHAVQDVEAMMDDEEKTIAQIKQMMRNDSVTNEDREHLDEELAELERAHDDSKHRHSQLCAQLDKVQAVIAHDTMDILQLEHNLHPDAPMRPEMQEQLGEKLRTLQEYVHSLEKDVEAGREERAALQQQCDEQQQELVRRAEELSRRQAQGDDIYDRGSGARSRTPRDGEAAQEIRRQLEEALQVAEEERSKAEKKAAKLPALNQKVADLQSTLQEVAQLNKSLQDQLRHSQLESPRQRAPVASRGTSPLPWQRDDGLSSGRKSTESLRKSQDGKLTTPDGRGSENGRLGDSLDGELSSLERAIGDRDMAAQLAAATAQVADLQQALIDAQQAAKKDKSNAEDALQKERKKLDAWKRKVVEQNEKEQEAGDLHQQLSELQMVNARLQDQLFAVQQRVNDGQRRAVDPEQLQQRLADVSRTLRPDGRRVRTPSSRSSSVASVLEALARRPSGGAGTDTGTASGGSLLDVALEQLRQELGQELEKSLQEKEDALEFAEQAQAEVAELRRELQEVKDAERERQEEAIQVALEEEREDKEVLLAELMDLKQQLYSLDVVKPPPGDGETGSSRTRSDAGTVSSEESTTSSSQVSSSQWSEKKKELFNTLTNDEQELFSELQDEISDLRDLLLRDNTSAAAKKVADVETMMDHIHRVVSSRSSQNLNSDTEETTSTATGSTVREMRKDPRMLAALEQLSHAQREVEMLKAQLARKQGKVASTGTGIGTADGPQHFPSNRQQPHPASQQPMSGPSQGQGQGYDANPQLQPNQDARTPLQPFVPRKPARDAATGTQSGGRYRPSDRSQAAGVGVGPGDNNLSPVRQASTSRNQPSHRPAANQSSQPQQQSASGRGARDGLSASRPGDNDRTNQPPHHGMRSDMRQQPSAAHPAGGPDQHPDNRHQARSHGNRDVVDGREQQRLDGRSAAQQPMAGNGYDVPDYSPTRDGRGYVDNGQWSSPDGRTPGHHQGQQPHLQQYPPNASLQPQGQQGYHDTNGNRHGVANAPNYSQLGSAINPSTYPPQQHPQHNIPGTSLHPQNTQHSGYPGAGTNFSQGQGQQPYGQPTTVPPPPGVAYNPAAAAATHGSQGPSQAYPPPQGPPPQSGLYQGSSQAAVYPRPPVQQPGLYPSAQAAAPHPYTQDQSQGQPPVYQGLPQQPVGYPAAQGAGMYPSQHGGGGGTFAAGSSVMPAPGGQGLQPFPAAASQLLAAVPLPLNQSQGATGQLVGMPVTMTTNGVPALQLANAQSAIANLSAGPLVAGDLLCSVNEHHDLEDHVKKLYKTIKKLQQRVEDSEDAGLTQSANETILRLQDELNERQSELEHLSVAMGDQRAVMKELREGEADLLRQRLQLGAELDWLEGPGAEYSKFMSEEIACLERTLRDRRVELREADSKLQHCLHSLDAAKTELNEALEAYEQFRPMWHSATEDYKEVEQRAYDTGVELLQLQEQRDALQAEVDKLKMERETTVHDTCQIVEKKKEEFRAIEQQIREAKQRYETSRQELSELDSRQLERLKMLKELDSVISEQHADLSRVKTLVSQEQAKLDEIKTDAEAVASELASNKLAVKQQQATLASVDADLVHKQIKLEAVLRELDGHAEQLAVLQEQVAVQQELVAENERQAEEHNQLMAEKQAEVQAAIDELRHERKVLTAAVGTMKKDRDSLDQSLTLARHTLDEQNKLLTSTSDTMIAKQQQLNELNSQLEQLDTLINIAGVNIEERVEPTSGTGTANQKTGVEGMKRLSDMVEKLAEQKCRVELILHDTYARFEAAQQNATKLLKEREEEMENLRLDIESKTKELHSARSKMAADMAEMQSVAQRQSSKVNDLESQTVRLSKSNTELEKHCQTLEEQLRELQQCHDQLLADHETLQVEHTELASASHSVPDLDVAPERLAEGKPQYDKQRDLQDSVRSVEAELQSARLAHRLDELRSSLKQIRQDNHHEHSYDASVQDLHIREKLQRKIQDSEGVVRSWYSHSRDNIEKLQQRISHLQQVLSNESQKHAASHARAFQRTETADTSSAASK